MIVETAIVGIEQLLAGFARIEAVTGDNRTRFEKLADPVFGAIRKRIDAQGYAPLNPDYAIRKGKKYGNKPILRATDEMYLSFTKGGSGSVMRISAMDAEYGSANPKATFHHEGLGRNPKRTIIDMTSQDESGFTSIFVDDLNERFRDIGFQVG